MAETMMDAVQVLFEYIDGWAEESRGTSFRKIDDYEIADSGVIELTLVDGTEWDVTVTPKTAAGDEPRS